MLKSKCFEQQYPTLSRFTDVQGCIEIGDHEVISAFVRAYDQSGTVYEGKSSYPSMDEALQDLEQGIQAYLDEHGIEL